jgi:DNA-binding NarL/FixJ family response regulator
VFYYEEDGSVRIVIADDQKHARQGLRALLAAELADVEIREAADGAEADRLAAEFQPDLILMDVRMPVLGGIAATRRIKQRQPGVKILVHSLDPCAAGEAISAGADAFVGKCEEPATLLRVVGDLLAGSACVPCVPIVESGGDETGTRG